jgi:hypothetical protein
MNIFDILGWLGMAIVVIAFGLNSMKRLSADSLAYILMNGGGSAFLIINCYHNHSMPPMVLNIIWLIIALISLWKYFQQPN